LESEKAKKNEKKAIFLKFHQFLTTFFSPAKIKLIDVMLVEGEEGLFKCNC
jgi:hypothetical protein